MSIWDIIKNTFKKNKKMLNEGRPIVDNQLEIEESEDDIINNETKNKILQENLMKYGITQDEWNEVERYKSTDYFVSNTLLHNIDLFELQRPAYGDAFNDLLDPKNAMNFYCKIYSAMYKYGKAIKDDRIIYRVCSELFYNEMKHNGHTESLLSFSTDGYHSEFFKDKNNPVMIQGNIKPGTPCIDFKEIYGYDIENEVLLPPFLGLDCDYKGRDVTYKCNQYSIDIKKTRKKDFEYSEEIEKLVFNSTIPEEYYRNWYTITASNPFAKGDDPHSKELRKKFIEWQKNFKICLQYKFKDIENEIDKNDKTSNQLQWSNLLKKGDILNNNGISFKISSDLMSYKETYAIYADLITENDEYVCMTGKIPEYKAPIIIKNKKLMEKMQLSVEERKAIYCHEIGHYYCQEDKQKKGRTIDDEIKSDNYAIKKLGVKPEIMRNAIKKMNEYYTKDNKDEKYDRIINELEVRIENIKKMQSMQYDFLDR